MNNILQYLGIGFILYLVANKAGGLLAEKFGFGTPRLKLGQSDFQGINVQLFLPVSNQTPVAVPIDGFTGVLSYGQAALANIQMNQPVMIQANGTTELFFNVRISYANLAGDIISLISSGQIWGSLRLQGQLYSQGITIPIDRTINVI